MNGKIFIKNLQLPVVIGHTTPERHAAQTIRINIAVWADVETSVRSGRLEDTIDYVVIQKEVEELARTKEYILIETFANDILEAAMRDKRIEKAWVSVEKPHKFPESESVGIEMERSR